jgi:hypothetical protein
MMLCVHGEIIQMATIGDGIVIGATGGAIAGSIVWMIKYMHDKVVIKIECNRVYKWLKENTTNEPGNQFRSTRAIASWNNLTEDRVRYICSIDKRMFMSTGEKEDMWGIYEHTPRSIYERRGIAVL